MVNVLAIGPNVHWSKPSQGDGFLRAINIRSTPSSEGVVKLDVPCHKILQHVKELNKQKIIVDRIHSNLLLVGSAGRIARESSGGQIRNFPQSV
jgi:hypothetical protein